MRRFVIFGVFSLLLVPGMAFAADEVECTATFDGALTRRVGTDTPRVYTAKVDVTAQGACAVVDFDLVVIEEVTEGEHKGEQKEVRLDKEVRVRAWPSWRRVSYKPKKGRALVSHRFEQTGCKLCD